MKWLFDEYRLKKHLIIQTKIFIKWIKNWTIPHKLNDKGIKWTIYILRIKIKGLQGRKPSKKAYIFNKEQLKKTYWGNRKTIIPIFFVSILWFLYGADGGTWTPTTPRYKILNLARLPIPPRPHIVLESNSILTQYFLFVNINF